MLSFSPLRNRTIAILAVVQLHTHREKRSGERRKRCWSKIRSGNIQEFRSEKKLFQTSFAFFVSFSILLRFVFLFQTVIPIMCQWVTIVLAEKTSTKYRRGKTLKMLFSGINEGSWVECLSIYLIITFIRIDMDWRLFFYISIQQCQQFYTNITHHSLYSS